MRTYQRKIIQDFHYKFLFPLPSFKNLISKISVIQSIRLKTIKDTSVMKAITLGELLFAVKPITRVKEIKYRFKEKYFMAKVELVLYNDKLREVLKLFAYLYYPRIKRYIKRFGFRRTFFYFSRNNNLTFLLPYKTFITFVKTEIAGSLRAPILIKFFLSKHCLHFYKDFQRIFQIYFLSRFIKFPLIRFGLRRRISRRRKFRTIKNILKISRYKW